MNLAEAVYYAVVNNRRWLTGAVVLDLGGGEYRCVCGATARAVQRLADEQGKRCTADLRISWEIDWGVKGRALTQQEALEITADILH